MGIIYNSYCFSRVLCEKGYNYIYNNELKNYIETKRIFGYNGGMLSAVYNLSKDATHILNSIYLGNAFNARDYYTLKENNIGLIINCTTDIQNYFENLDEFEYHRVSVKDSGDSHIYNYLDDMADTINNYIVKNPDKNILIHCFMGSSRSATILIAYMMKYLNYTRRESINFLKEKRDLVNLNLNFFEDLKIYEDTLY